MARYPTSPAKAPSIDRWAANTSLSATDLFFCRNTGVTIFCCICIIIMELLTNKNCCYHTNFLLQLLHSFDSRPTYMGLVELFQGMVISGIAIGIVSLGAGVYFEFFRSKKYEYPRERLRA